MSKGIQANRRAYLLQDIQNFFPLESRGRQSKYSNLAQIFHPVAFNILEQQLEAERALSNYIPPLIDTEEIDCIYKVPNIFGTSTSTPKFYDGTNTSFTEVIEVPEDFSEFWYDALPTRLEYLELNARTLHNEKVSGVNITNTATSYSLQNNYLSTSTNEVTLTNGSSVLVNNLLYTLCTSGTELGVTFLSTSTATDPFLYYAFYDEIKSDSIQRKEISYGIDGISTTISTDTEINLNTKKYQYYSYDAIGETGTPFLSISYFMTSTSTSDVILNNWYIKDYASLQNLTSSPYMNKQFGEENPNHCYVKIRGGDSLVVPNSSFPDSNAGVIISGINNKGIQDKELVLTPYNGAHQSLKIWKEITSATPYNLPSGCYYDVELQNYQKDYPVLDTVQFYTEPTSKSLLFRNISTDVGTAFLEFRSPFSGLLELAGTEASVIRKKIELRDSSDSAFTAIDAAYDFLNQLVYVLDTSSKIHMFDLYDHWPAQTAITALNYRSIDPRHIIELENYEDDTVVYGETKTIKNYLKDRTVRLSRYRIIIQKPDGTVKGLDDSFSEVGITTDFWINNTGLFDVEKNQYQFAGSNIPVTFNQYGDWIVILESEFLDEETSNTFREKDVLLFIVPKKVALKTFTINSSLGNPIGIDFLPNKDISLAFSDSNNPYSLFEETYRLRYDYYYKTSDRKNLIFREDYGNIYIILNSGDNDLCSKTILIKTNNDDLTVNQIDCYFVLANSSSGNISFALPEIDNSLNGKTIVIKRYGANAVTVSRGASDTIDGSTTLSFIDDLDAYNLTAIYDMNMWAIS